MLNGTAYLQGPDGAYHVINSQRPSAQNNTSHETIMNPPQISLNQCKVKVIYNER